MSDSEITWILILILGILLFLFIRWAIRKHTDTIPWGARDGNI